MVIFSTHENNLMTDDTLKQNVATDIFHSRLDITVRSLECTHRIGAKRQNTTRPFMLTLLDYSEMSSVLASCAKLREASPSISNEYSQVTLEKHRQIWSSAKGGNEAGS